MSTRLLVVALGSERRWKRTLGFGAVGAVLLGGGIFAAVRTVDAKASAEVEKNWNSLNTCLLGEPLKTGETAGARVQAIQLSIVGVLKERRSKPNELAWPASCATAAAAFGENAKSASNGSPALGEAALALATAIRADLDATGDFRDLVDKVWSDPAAAKLTVKPVTDVPAAPKPAAPLYTGETFKALPRLLSGSFSLSSVRPQPYAGSKVHFLVDQKDTPEGPVACTATAKESTIRCKRVPEAAAKLSPGLRLWGTTEDDAQPFYFAGDRGQLGIFPAEGAAKVADGVALGASARSSGLWALVRAKEGLRMISRPASGIGLERPALIPTEVESSYTAGLFWEWLVYKSPKRGAASHFMARPLGGVHGDPGPAVDVGELADGPRDEGPEKEAIFTACRTDEGTAFRVRGGRNDTIAFFADGQWSAPVAAGTRGGALTCRGLEAYATQITHAVDGDKNFPTVTQAKCTTTGCASSTLAFKSMLSGIGAIAPADANAVSAADVGGKLLVVWNGGYVGGLRMRFAPAERIKDAEDTVIFDGRGGDAGMKLSSVVEVKAVPAHGFALLFVNTTSGVRVLRVEPAGTLTPLQIAL